MKKIALILIMTILIATAIPWALVAAQSNHTTHEDPATAETSYNISLSILTHYGDILSKLANGEYSDINTLIQQLDIDTADIPENIKTVMNTYNSLLSNLSAKLNNLDTLLDEAEKLLYQNKFEETHEKLDDASELIEEIETLLEDIDNANEELISLLGPYASVLDTEAVNESRAKLLEAIERLQALKAEYKASLQYLEGKAEQEIILSFTNLTLETQAEAWVGDSITVSGVLTSEEGGEALANKEITILLNGKVAATTTTDANGQYEAEAGKIEIPYLYISIMTVQSSYIPKDEDTEKYSLSSSPLVDIEIMFYSTELTLEVPEQAYPGFSYKISGQIIQDAEASSIEREISLFYDDELLITIPPVVYSNQDTFEIEFIPNDQTTLGEHVLTATVESQDSYSNASIDKTITIVKESPEISIDNLSYSIMSRKLQVRGELTSDLPLQEATVIIEMKGISTTVSASSDEMFEATLSLPLDAITIGNQEVKITVEPSEVWHLTNETTVEVFIVDIVNVGLVSVAFICIGLVLYTTKRSRLKKEYVDIPESSLLPQEPIEMFLQKSEKLEGTRAKIYMIYIEITRAIEAAIKAHMKPQMTLREFLKKTTPDLENAAGPFTELTHLTENALYSPDIPEADKAARAEELALIIKETLPNDRA